MFAEDLSLPKIQCIHFTRQSEMPDLADVRKQGLALAELDATGVRSEEELFSAMAQALQFPEWFGGNWDAVNDCLRDLEWFPGKGYVLVIHKANELWSQATSVAGDLLESWLFCAEFWLEERVPFHLIFIMDE